MEWSLNFSLTFNLTVVHGVEVNRDQPNRYFLIPNLYCYNYQTIVLFLSLKKVYFNFMELKNIRICNVCNCQQFEFHDLLIFI